MIPEPLNGWVDGCGYPLLWDTSKPEPTSEDMYALWNSFKLAVEFLKKNLNDTAFIEHLTELQIKELEKTVCKAFPDLHSKPQLKTTNNRPKIKGQGNGGDHRRYEA